MSLAWDNNHLHTLLARAKCNVFVLTHSGRVTHICVSKLEYHWFRLACCLYGAKPLPEPMLFYFNWTFTNKLQSTFDWNSNIFIRENPCEMSSAKCPPFCLGLYLLKNGHRDLAKSRETSNINSQNAVIFPKIKMAAISQTIFSYAFSWMKRFVFWFEFHWSLFLRVQLTITQHWFRWWLGAE